ncbi:ankyrin repeat and death domain-containing protein 1A-like isoform X4 [Vespa velutina]|uniref:ankyrin repeat and death domain-containing protein 1A-like isoform X4 n=1 Tax=Vespa velutina TaxID=202808 RepID=UPI001FB32A7D|nr:ankyrin repeat and death domain-containing protein 1A-like isoform X4 [Vespa velutina]
MKRILLYLPNSFIEIDVRKKIRKEITRETKKMMDKGETSKGKIPTPLNISETIENEVLNKKMAQILKNDLLLHEAVIKNEAESVARVLKEDVDVDSRNNYGRAPIHWAASRGNTEIIEMLIQAKCDIEAKDKYGMRPLHMAAWYGHQDAVKILINAGANVSAVNKEKESCFLSFYLCLSQKQYTLLMCGARGNNANVVQYLAEAVESLNGDAMDYTGATALHHAAVAGHPGVISAICNIPRIELNATDKIGQAPIHRACSEEHLGAVAALIDLGANVNAQDNEGNTPLHVATRMRQIEMVQLLLKAGANTELTDQNGNTALHLACQNNEVDTVEILINKGVDLNCLNLRMQSPIHIAAEMGHTEICELLLASGANIEQREQSGRTPLYIAARGSFTAIVDMIIKTARLDYPTPENSNSDKEVRELTPARRRWREGSRGGSMCSNNSALTEPVRSVLWKLAYKQLGPEDWKKLALHWAFSHEQIKAIEHQYTVANVGPSSYKEHGFRMLMIWTSGLNSEAPLVKELCEALQAIDKKNLADSIRKQTNLENEVKLNSNKQSCHECLIV